MKTPFFSKTPRPALNGGYVCDVCGKVVSTISSDGERYLCHDCKVKQENSDQPQPEASEKQ